MNDWLPTFGNLTLDPYDPHPMPAKPYTIVKYKFRLDVPESFTLAGLDYELREEATSYRVYRGEILKFILSKDDVEYCTLVEVE